MNFLISSIITTLCIPICAMSSERKLVVSIDNKQRYIMCTYEVCFENHNKNYVDHGGTFLDLEPKLFNTPKEAIEETSNAINAYIAEKGEGRNARIILHLSKHIKADAIAARVGAILESTKKADTIEKTDEKG